MRWLRAEANNTSDGQEHAVLTHTISAQHTPDIRKSDISLHWSEYNTADPTDVASKEPYMTTELMTP